MGTYTGVLLSTTAIPLWHEATELLPPLFFSSGLSNASAALQLVLLLSGEDEKSANFRALETIETCALFSELTLIGVGRWKLGDLLTRPLTRGNNGKLFMFGSIGVGMLLPLLLQFLSKNRAVRLLAALLTLAGGFVLRYCIIEGGKLSADDPQAYHSVTGAKGVPKRRDVSVDMVQSQDGPA
jgi:formate-dependent nitrite reductase membrane component NrfD